MSGKAANFFLFGPVWSDDPLVVLFDVLDQNRGSLDGDYANLAVAESNPAKVTFDGGPIFGIVLRKPCTGHQVETPGVVGTFVHERATAITKVARSKEPNARKSNAGLRSKATHDGVKNVGSTVLAGNLCG
jgi:hypothetical protein